MPTGEHATGEVDNHTAESQSLTFMNSDCPCQPYGELRESTQDFFFNLFFLFVVFIADIFPVFRLDVTFFSIIGDDVESFFYFIEAADYANSTITQRRSKSFLIKIT